MTPGEDFRLGEWLVQPSLNRVSRAGESASLQPRFMDLLVHLARSHGKVVSKEEILDAVWAKEFVSEGTLTHAIAVIRQTLGDDVRKPEFIETIPTRGYRLIAPVLPVAAEPTTPPPVRPAAGRGTHRAARVVLIAVAAGALASAVGWVAMPWLGRTGLRIARGRPVKVVVLPFLNLGPAAREYVALGITDDITTRLASVRGIVVSSRTSAAYCAKEGRSVRQIAGELGVGFIIEGSVRWESGQPDGQTLRVNAQLIRAGDDAQLWGRSYRADAESAVELGALIAREAVQELGVPVRNADESRLAAMPTENGDAYQAYLCGMRYHELDGREQLGLAAAMFDRAVKLDPTFALALARLSVVHARIYDRGIDRSPERLAKAEQAARLALELHPASAEAHLALGAIAHLGRRDFAAALAEYRVAARDLPNDSELVVLTADVYRRQGKWAEARRELTRLVDLDPSDYGALLALGDTLTDMRQYAEADQAFGRATNVAPDRVEPYVRRFWNRLRWDGDTGRAESVLADVPVRDSPEVILCRSYLRYLTRDFRGALDTLSQVTVDPQSGPLRHVTRALLECRYLDAAGESAGRAAACEGLISSLELKAGPPSGQPWPRLALAWAYAVLGRRSEASRAADETAAAHPISGDAVEGAECALQQAQVLARIGDSAQVSAIVNRLLAIPSPVSVAWLRLDPAWDTLRASPEFSALLR